MSETQDDLFGTDPHKLARTNDPGTSKSSAHTVDSSKWEQRVLEMVRMFGANGCTQEQVLDVMYHKYGVLPYSTITARFKALEDKGLIRYTGEKRAQRSGRQSRVRVAV